MAIQETGKSIKVFVRLCVLKHHDLHIITQPFYFSCDLSIQK